MVGRAWRPGDTRQVPGTCFPSDASAPLTARRLVGEPRSTSPRNHVGRAAERSPSSGVVRARRSASAPAGHRSPSAARNSPDLGLGDQTFRAADAERLAEEIADRGPIFYGDVSGRKDRDIILQHLGDDPDEGWYAFLAAPVDKGRDCTWQWQPDEELFRAKCDDVAHGPGRRRGAPAVRGHGRRTAPSTSTSTPTPATPRTTTTTAPELTAAP